MMDDGQAHLNNSSLEILPYPLQFFYTVSLLPFCEIIKFAEDLEKLN